MTELHVDNRSESETELFALGLAELLEAGDLVVLSGDLGAGKTFLCGALCHALGLPEDEAVTSPTFTLVHEYPTEPPVRHADLYRLAEPDEVEQLELDVARRDGAIALVEWGRPFVRELGGDAIFLDLDLEPRRIVVTGLSERPRRFLSRLHAFLSEDPRVARLRWEFRAAQGDE